MKVIRSLQCPCHNNCLPIQIKQLSGDVNKFKLALKKFLLAGSFYSMEEFLEWTILRDLNALYS